MSKLAITLTVPPELVEELDTRAEAQYRSRSSLASQLIAEGLKDGGQVEPGLLRSKEEQSA